MVMIIELNIPFIFLNLTRKTIMFTVKISDGNQSITTHHEDINQLVNGLHGLAKLLERDKSVRKAWKSLIDQVAIENKPITIKT